MITNSCTIPGYISGSIGPPSPESSRKNDSELQRLSHKDGNSPPNLLCRLPETSCWNRSDVLRVRISARSGYLMTHEMSGNLMKLKETRGKLLTLIYLRCFSLLRCIKSINSSYPRIDNVCKHMYIFSFVRIPI